MAEASVQGRIYSVFWKDLSAYFLLFINQERLPTASAGVDKGSPQRKSRPNDGAAFSGLTWNDCL